MIDPKSRHGLRLRAFLYLFNLFFTIPNYISLLLLLRNLRERDGSDQDTGDGKSHASPVNAHLLLVRRDRVEVEKNQHILCGIFRNKTSFENCTLEASVFSTSAIVLISITTSRTRPMACRIVFHREDSTFATNPEIH